MISLPTNSVATGSSARTSRSGERARRSAAGLVRQTMARNGGQVAQRAQPLPERTRRYGLAPHPEVVAPAIRSRPSAAACRRNCTGPVGSPVGEPPGGSRVISISIPAAGVTPTGTTVTSPAAGITPSETGFVAPCGSAQSSNTRSPTGSWVLDWPGWMLPRPPRPPRRVGWLWEATPCSGVRAGLRRRAKQQQPSQSGGDCRVGPNPGQGPTRPARRAGGARRPHRCRSG